VTGHPKASSAGSTSSSAPSIARLGALSVVLAFVCAAFAPAAMAAPEATPTYTPAGIFGAPGTEAGQFTSPTHIAVEPGTGNVLVADSGNGRIQVFAPNGGAPTFLTSFGPGTLTTPVGIAIDQATGAIYVSDSGANKIFRFSSDGAATPTYSQDLGFASPAQGTAVGQVGSFASAIAVDPVTHDLLVADSGNKRVDRFASTGTAVASFNGTVSVSDSLTGPFDIAVGPSGALYVVDVVAGGDPSSWTGPPESFLKRFTATGAADGELEGSNVPAAVAVDPGSGRVIVAGDSVYSTNPHSLYIYAGEGTQPISVAKLASEPGTFGFSGLVHGMAIDGGPSGRLYSLSDYFDPSGPYGFLGVQVLDAGAIPGVEIDPPSGPTTTTVHLGGQVDPGGQPTSVHFEYSGDGGGSWDKTPDQELASKTGVQPVEADLAELAPNTEYQVRLEAANPGGYSTTSGIQTFSTAQAPPAVITGSANHIAATQVTLNGKINPFGLQTTYGFEYGETAAYGNTVPLAADGIAGNGRVLRSFSRVASGLSPGTTYHFRLVAKNAAGTTAGEDQVFTPTAAGSEEVNCPNAALRTGLSAGLPECRAYEQVSPVDKGGAIIAELYGFQSKPDGDGIVYTTRSPSSDVESTVRFTRFASMRSANGWSTRPIDPPSRTEFHGTATFVGQLTLAVSEDLSKSFVVSTHALAPGGVEDNTNLYVRDLQAGTYALVATSAEPLAYESFINYSGAGEFDGGANDFSWIVFTSRLPLLPEASYNQVYRWSEAGGLELVARLPGGSPTGSSARMGQQGFPRLPVTRFASDDGTEIAFALEEADAGAYLWKEGTITAISVSQVEGGPPGAQPAYVTGISRDGRYVTFIAYGGPPLTDDATAGVALYRFDVLNEQLEYLGASFTTETERLRGVPAVSEDGSHVYFQDLNWLSVWSQGTARQIAPVTVGNLIGYGASPDGRYFAYEDAEEVYLYDFEEDELSCASCPTDGSKSLGGHLPEGEVNPGHTFPQLVTDRGQVFFNTATPLLPRDVNGKQDVYVFDHGDVRLISPGTDNFKAYFAGLSADGGSAFFFTDQSLVAQDRDGGATDVYDARVNGGIASQRIEPIGECAGENCRGAVSAAGSESTTGPGSPSARAHRQCGKRHGKKSKGKARCAKPSKKHAKRRQAR
jgi:sugar lactone lactonase YvrE